MKFAIVGLGGVGGLVGGMLHEAGHDVVCVARGAHREAVRKSGLRIISPGQTRCIRVNCTDDLVHCTPVDVVLFCVKLYDTLAAARAMVPLLNADTEIISLQNGVEAASELSAILQHAKVHAGCVYVSAHVSAPGLIETNGVQPRLLIPRFERSNKITDAFRASGIAGESDEAIDGAIWTKFARLSSYSALCAMTRSSIGTVRSQPSLRKKLIGAVDEALAVASATGIQLPGSIAADIMSGLDALPEFSKPSMLIDLEKGKPLELRWLSGAVQRLGRNAGLPTPIHSSAYRLLHSVANSSTSNC